MKTCIRLISIMIFAFLGVGSLFAARTGASQGVAPALTGSRIATTVELAQNMDPRTPKPTAQTSTKKKALNPRSPWPPHWPTNG